VSKPVSLRRQRTLLWGCGVVIATWLGARVPGLIHRARQARWTLENQVATLERSREDLTRAVAQEDSAAAIKGVLLAQAPRLLSGSAGPEAADALAGLVTLAVTRGNARLTRTEAIPDSTTRGRLGRAGVLVGFDADVRGLATVLQYLSTGDPVLSVESVHVLVADPSAPPNTAEVLRIELVVRGWFLKEADT